MPVRAAYPAFPLILTASSSFHFECPSNRFDDSEPPLRGLVLRSCHRIIHFPFRMRLFERERINVICRRIPTAHAYLKSTDGHHGKLCFHPLPSEHYPRSPRLLLVIIRHLRFVSASARLILVDSTRAGKRLPDALSKTVPIWCAVINRATRMRRLLARRRTTAGEQEERGKRRLRWICTRHRGQSALTSTRKSPRGFMAGPQPSRCVA